MKSFEGKVVAITGAASGIGRALAQRFAREGAELALCDVDEGGLKDTAELVKTRRRVSLHRVDVGDREAVEAWAAAAAAEHGGVDAIVNNAGVTSKGSLAEARYDDIEWVLRINLWGVIHGVKAFLPLLERRPEGHIVNISSINALVPFPDNGPYNISKYAVAGLSETLMQELSGTRISVSCVHPGGIDTDIVRSGRNLSEAEGDRFQRAARTSPERAAEVIVAGLKRDRPRILVGADAAVMAAMKRLLPISSVRLAGRLASRLVD